MTTYVATGSAPASAAFHGVQAMNYGRFPLGSCALTNGSPDVVGTGTHFTTGVEVGYGFHNQDTGTVYVVQSITDDTHLTLTSNVTDPTGSYDCSPDFQVPSSTFTRVPLRGPDVWDTDSFHFTDHSALSGTVTKSSSSTTITGSGTSFTSQLNVNQVVDIPGGGGTDTVVVKSIADDTHFTVWANPTYSASAQTATKNSDCIAVPAGITGGAIGNFLAHLYATWAPNGTGVREVDLVKNVSTGTSITAQNQIQGTLIPTAGANTETWEEANLPFQAQDGDQLSCYVWQNSGGNVGLTPNFPAGTSGGMGGFGYGLTLKFDGIPA